MDDLHDVVAVKLKGGFTARLRFDDGTEREIDLDRYLHGPILGGLREDAALFRQAYVANGTLTWPNGADIDPEVLYYDLGPNPTEAAWRAAIATQAPA